MPTRTTRRTRPTILRVTELERRDTPAWWAVAAPVPAEGVAGTTDATHSGSLTLNPDYAATNGTVTVWADTATEAAAKRINGTVTVTLLGQSVAYAFGPSTVGTAVADHKAFLAVASGNGVSIRLEDMAGFGTSDWDYDDRTWGGVTVSGAPDPVVDTGNWTWANAQTGEFVEVQMTVTQPAPDKLRWHYDVANKTFSVSNSNYRGVGRFWLNVEDATGVTA